MLRLLRGAAFALVCTVCTIAPASAAPSFPAPGLTAAPAIEAQAKRRAPKKKAQPKQDPDDDGKAARIWRFVRDASGPILSFGNRKGDDAIVAFSCQPGSGEIRAVAYTASRGTRRGDAARLRFTNGRQRLEIAGTAFADVRQNRIDIGGVTTSTVQFADLFRGGETMIVEVPGRKVGVSLKTLGNKAAQFAAACRAKT